MTAEGLLKTRIRKKLTDMGIFWSSIQAGPGSKPGDPDLIICCKGRFIGIEVKTASGRQSPVQRVREEQITANGGIYKIVKNMNDLMEILEEYNGDIDSNKE